MQQTSQVMPEFLPKFPGDKRHMHDWSPEQFSAFRRAAGQCESIGELAERTGYCTRMASYYLGELGHPMAFNLHVAKMAPRCDDAEGADLMDRIEGKSDRRHLLPNQEQKTVNDIVALAEAYYEVPPGAVSSGSVKKNVIRARHGAIKVAIQRLPGVTQVRIAKLIGGLTDKAVATAISKPNVLFRDFIDHAEQVLA